MALFVALVFVAGAASAVEFFPKDAAGRQAAQAPPAALNQDQRSEFERHLAVCPSCVAYLKTYEQTIFIARSAANEQPPEDVPESLLRAILAARNLP